MDQFRRYLSNGTAQQMLSQGFLGAEPGSSPDQLDGLNFDDKRTRIPLMIAIVSTAIVLIAVFVTTRLCVRGFMTRRFFLDDSK